MTEAGKKHVDWELVEKDFRAGIKTVRQIAEERGVSHTAILKRARRDGWERTKRAVPATEDRSVAVSEVGPNINYGNVPGFVYVIFVYTGSEFFYKIGQASNVDARLKSHQTSSPFEVRIALAYFVDNMRREESTLHAMFADKRIRGEWFQLEREDLELIAKRSLLA
jgi:hypothetical protein